MKIEVLNYQTRETMLKSTKSLIGYWLTTTDGDLGRIKDFYFDDQNCKSDGG
jgi:uncharacterized protein YrrD